YLRLVVWPSPLLIHYQLPYLATVADAWPYVIPLVLLASACLLLLWRNHPVGFLSTAVFMILAPTFIVPIVTEMAAERRMYLPLAALALLFVVGGYLLAELISRRSAKAGQSWFGFSPTVILSTLLLIAIVFGLASAKRVAAYHQPVNLWHQVVR